MASDDPSRLPSSAAAPASPAAEEGKREGSSEAIQPILLSPSAGQAARQGRVRSGDLALPPILGQIRRAIGAGDQGG